MTTAAKSALGTSAPGKSWLGQSRQPCIVAASPGKSGLPMLSRATVSPASHGWSEHGSPGPVSARLRASRLASLVRSTRVSHAVPAHGMLCRASLAQAKSGSVMSRQPRLVWSRCVDFGLVASGLVNSRQSRIAGRALSGCALSSHRWSSHARSVTSRQAEPCSAQPRHRMAAMSRRCSPGCPVPARLSAVVPPHVQSTRRASSTGKPIA